MPPQSKAWPVLVLHQNGDLTPASIPAPGALTLAAIQKFLKQKRGVECLANYKAKSQYLYLFGLSDGADDQLNQHQLPPPYETTSFYGDIVLVVSKDAKRYDEPIPFKPEQYEEFYTKMYDGGYDSDQEGGEQGEDDLEGGVAAGDVDEVEADGDDIEEDAEEEDAEEEDAEEDAEAEADADGDAEEVAAPKPKAAAASKKKKSSAAAAKSGAAALSGTGSAYPNPPILSETEQLQEELPNAPFPATETLAAARRRIICALGAIFQERLTSDELAALERAIYNGAIHQARQRHVVRTWSFPLFAHLYTMHAHHVASNFQPESYVKNAELFDSYQRGDLSLESIANMNNYELFPSHWRVMFEQRAIREKKQLEGNKDRATDQFTCTRCWKKECTYYEMQTRSADEPMTIFITCLNCGKKWRQ